MTRIEYEGDYRRGKLVVDGVDLSDYIVPEVTIRTERGELPTVEATIIGRSVIVAVEGLLHLNVPDEVEALLTAAGWTPPREDD